MASTAVLDIPERLAPAYRECIALARSHYENFTVAGRFLPKRLLPHVAAIYAYCRGVDDLGDEAVGDRLALLDAWEADLEQAYAGTPTAPHLQALQHTIRAFSIPPEPFRKLITANRMDQTQSRYATFADVLHYCEHSANPVGFLYLLLFGYDDETRRRLSDATCTALQLANFWQDVRRDWDKGRVYLPQEDMERFGYSEKELGEGVCNQAFRDLMAWEVERAQGLFEQGLPLVEMLEGTAAAARQALQSGRHACAGRNPGARLRCPLKAASGLGTPQGMALGKDVPWHETHAPYLEGGKRGGAGHGASDRS